MKSLCTKTCSAFFAAAILFSSTPLVHATGTTTLRAAERRCARTAGREQARCKFVNSRTERLRYTNSRNGYTRGHTLREMRHVSKNRPATDIRRIGSPNLARLRRHNRNGGNARRLINTRDENARTACEQLRGTNRYMCIRGRTRAFHRGETR